MGDLQVAAIAKPREGDIASIKCPMLTSSNYTVWSMRMRILLRVHEVWEIVETASDNSKKNDMAIALLFQAISESMVLQVGKQKRFGMQLKRDMLEPRELGKQDCKH